MKTFLEQEEVVSTEHEEDVAKNVAVIAAETRRRHRWRRRRPMA